MFGLIRLILGCFLLLFLVFMVSRTKLTHKWCCYITCVIITTALVTVSAFVPLENVFFSFDTPEAAYDYYTFGSTDVKLVVRGKCCDLVIGDKQNSNVYLIVPKTEDGWKVGIGADTKKITQRIIDNIVVYVYQYKDTDDYFVTVFDTSGRTLEIEDSCNSNFLNLARKNNSTDKTFVSYHTSVVSLDNEYLLNINGTVISVAGQGAGSVVP